jgi:1-acyl-sn-glycerol-3-phosphate acyltransferase
MAESPKARGRDVQPWYGIIVWYIAYVFLWVVHSTFHRLRTWNARYVPSRGPVLMVCNHQSFFDPPVIGVAVPHRPFRSLARASLFRNPLFGWLIATTGAIPVERDKVDMAAMRTCIDVLSDGQALLLFPEGTRTEDGVTGPFEHGIMMLIRRARPTVVPVAIDGAFAIWPRHRKWPRLHGRIGVMFAPPIAADELLAMPAAQAADHLRNAVEQTRLELARKLGRGPDPAPSDAA